MGHGNRKQFNLSIFGTALYTWKSMATISLHVDHDTARAFSAAPPEERRKLELLLSLRLRELIDQPARPLSEIMDEIGRQAEANGMTPELLDSLLNDI
jgi:hypothetical protein